MTDSQMVILKAKLEAEFVPQLVPLLDPANHIPQQPAKNVSRAFAAFALQKIAGLDTASAAKAVVDDFEDNAIDAIYYHQAGKKLFLLQGKLKADEPFSQPEATLFIKGVRDLLNQHYDRFNDNVKNRQAEIEFALSDANEIVLVIAHTAPIISQHAAEALTQFLGDAGKPDDRLEPEFIDYGPASVVDDLLAEQAIPTVSDAVMIFGHHKIDGPRETHYGQVSLPALAAMLVTHKNALFEKNIRFSLGVGSSDVNRAILETLSTKPADFFYLNNGVTAIANSIEPKEIRDGGRRFKVNGFSIINGAQTIATCQHFIASNPGADISAARVLLTLIQVDENDVFSTDVTRARNHQNPVASANFAALDGVQERLRRELAFLNIVYRYRPEVHAGAPGSNIMSIEDASVAIALFMRDPGMAVTLKRDQGKLLDPKNAEYGRIFNTDLSGQRLANAVRLYARASQLMWEHESAAVGQEKLIYRHGRFAIMWLTFGANMNWLDRSDVMTETDAKALLSAPLDIWREKVRAEVKSILDYAGIGPLAFFRSLTWARPTIIKLRDAGI